MEKDRRKIYEQVKAATVAICLYNPEGRLTPFGSGINVDPSGIVVTCKHVIEDAQVHRLTEGGAPKFAGSEQGIQSNIILMYDIVAVFSLFNNNNLELGIARFEVIHGPHNTDLAICRLHPDSPLPFAKLGNSDEVFEGQFVFACGFPLGSDLQPNNPVCALFNHGIVSGVRTHYLERPYRQFLLDMSINPGNSGGPLCSEDNGEVIGLINARVDYKDLPTGIGCAVPANLIKPFIDRVLALTDQQLEEMRKGIWPSG